MSVDIYLVDEGASLEAWYIGQPRLPVQFKERFHRRDQAPPVGIVIPADGQLPRCCMDGLAIEVSELWQLEQILQAPLGWQRVVFVPSGLAKLDNLRSSRRVLVAARPLRQHDILTRDMVGIAYGLSGICASKLDDLAGRVLCYDVSAGDPLAFGLVDISEADKKTDRA